MFSDKCPIKLLPHQIEHVEKIWKLLTKDRVFSFSDSSKTGLGKTHISLFLSWHLQHFYGTKTFIVAPSDTSLNSEDGWLTHAEEAGIEIVDAQTYPSIRGGRGKVSHRWLIPNPENKKSWKVTGEFIQICKQGVFLIFDEFHNCKNASMTHFACAALVKAAKEHRDVCRVALLSHTPGDKISCIPQILRMMGLITSTKLFKHIPFTREYEYKQYGLGELEKICCKLARNEDARLKIERAMHRISGPKANSIVKELYDEHIRSIVTFAMPIPKTDFNSTLLNAFLETDEESLKMINDGINLLSSAVNWDPVLQQVSDQGKWELGNISIGLRLIEKAKLMSIARYVKEEYKKNPHKKFVICCGGSAIAHHEILASMINEISYKDIVSELREKNLNWKKLPKDMINYMGNFLNLNSAPDILNGETPKEKRVEIIRNFQKNTKDSWCLIMSPGVGSESISLHDRHGNHQREMLITPSFHFSKILQSTGRVDRVGKMSDTKTMIVYSKNGVLETSILNSMIKKSQVARGLMADDQKVVFPAQFDYYIEGEKDQALENQLNELRNM